MSPSKVAIRARPPNFDTKFRTRRSKWRISSRTSPSFSLVGKPNSFSDSAEKHKISYIMYSNDWACWRTATDSQRYLAGSPQRHPSHFQRESTYSTRLYTVTCGEISLWSTLPVWHIWTRRREERDRDCRYLAPPNTEASACTPAGVSWHK